MSDAIIVAIVSGLFTLLGSFAGAMTSHNLTAYRLQQLEKKVEKHNEVIERTFQLEGRMTEVEHDIVDLKKKG
ncbi:MAG: hypothetical protein ACI3U8_07465 [Candidatus Onthomonas sp.]